MEIQTHFIPDGKPAPPRPRKPDALISEIIYDLVSFSGCLDETNLQIPSRDPSAGFPSSCANRHISSRWRDLPHDAHKGFGISCPDPSSRPTTSSLVVVVHLELWQVFGFAAKKLEGWHKLP